MAVTLDDKLVVAISSRALFNFEEENRVFEQSDDRAYVQLQRERLQLPAALKPYKHKLFGLTIDPDRLTAIRHERKPNSRYASYAQCEFEVREVENLFRRENIAHINSTHFSVEEISAKILVEKGVERRFK